MAGDWIKIEKATARKDEVLSIADALNIHPDHAFGLCVRFWMWCDDGMTDGHARRVTNVTLDAVFGRDGFVDALLSVGWLRVRDGSLEVPNFDRHMSDSAKNRALSGVRQQKRRSKPVTEMSRAQRDESVTREEKRRVNTEEHTHARASPILNDGPSDSFRAFAKIYPRWMGEAAAWKAWQVEVWRLVSEQGMTDAEAEQTILAGAQRYRDGPAGKAPASPRDDDFRFSPEKWLKGGHHADSDEVLQRPNGRAERSRPGTRRAATKPALVRDAADESLGDIFDKSAARLAERTAGAVPET